METYARARGNVSADFGGSLYRILGAGFEQLAHGELEVFDPNRIVIAVSEHLLSFSSQATHSHHAVLSPP